MSKTFGIIGAGLAGCEAAWQLAQAGCDVVLYEMKPQRFSPAHHSENLAELVCSNSFRSAEPETGIGLLKLEMAELGSLVMDVAKGTEVPAGKALAVDRDLFAREMTRRILEHPRITLVIWPASSVGTPWPSTTPSPPSCSRTPWT
jgi:methylenetetrahydrofolate--tRNA-(uracil-5-)-methyltransferase